MGSILTGVASVPMDRAPCSRDSATEDWVFVEVQERHVLRLLKAGGIDLQRGPRDPPQKIAPLTQFERCLLSSPPLNEDFRLAPDVLKSKVTLVNPKPAYHTGDSIQFRADLYDGYGHPRVSGGDEVRMRVISNPGQRTSVAAEVKDLGNGSYLGTTVLPWKGTALVRVYVTYPREFRREAVRYRLTLLSARWTTALFKAGSVRQRTACLPSLPIPGYDTVCNLTDFNGGLSFFCGRPTKGGLLCQHLLDFTCIQYTSAPDISSGDQRLINETIKPGNLRLIPNNISISIETAQAARQPDLPPCWKTSPRDTWQTRAPRGWFDSGGVWHSFQCSLPKTVSHQHVQRCLRNTTMYLIGDSNLRSWYYMLRGHLKCSKDIGPVSKDVMQQCEVASSNTSIRFAFHARPTVIMHYDNTAPLPLVLADLRHQLRQQPRRVIIVLHYFLHMALYGPSHYVARLRVIRRYLQDFLQEFPETTVVIRGPHAMFTNFLSHGDVFGAFFIQALHSELEGLRDRVRFLDFWDMTIAAQSMGPHPDPWIRENTMKTLLGHVCEGLV